MPNFIYLPRFVHLFLLPIFHIHIPTVAPFVQCNVAKYVIGGGLIVDVSSTSALFFFRVKAVYCNNRIITVFFGLLWFALFGLCFAIPFGVKVELIGQICIITRVEHYALISLIVHVIFDTLVFLAIPLRLLSFSIMGDTFGARMRSFFRGDGLPGLSRSLLYGGQLYYLLVISPYD
jgi:hypothetical protein